MTFSSALSGLKAANADLRITGNNIANASTNGFKESRGEFADVFAASALGTSSTAIGTGVRLSRVAQQFTQGTISFTDNNLDLAINGQGFFALDKGGERLYTRAGAFSVDREGNLVNGDGARLVGFQPDFTGPDPEGTISGALGTLRLDTANIPPVATSQVTTTLNLDSSQAIPTAPFSTGFTPTSVPPLNSYNNATSTTIYDSLGNAHVLTNYFVKTATPNQWQVFVGVDGTDVTPTPTTGVPKPFILTFDSKGALVPNNPSAPPVINSVASVTSSTGSLVNAGAVPVLASGELTINGTTIPASVAGSDLVSSSDNAGSAIALKAAIDSASVSGLTATLVPTSLNLGAYTAGASAFAGTDFQINGQNIVPGSSSEADLLIAINAATGTTGVSGANVSGSIVLTAADSRNIQVTTDGSTPTGSTFGNFSLSAPLDQVQRASLTLSQTGPTSITIAGTAPLDGGFTPGTTFATVTHTNSDIVSISNYNPGTGAATQTFTMDFSKATQFGSAFAVQALIQDGSTTGRLASVDADASGVMFARFTNGRSRKLGQVMLANFSNIQGLRPQGNTNWNETFDSGVALEGTPQTSNLGAIQAGGLEDSNVDLTEELVNLIIAQRNSQANAQTIRTTDEIEQTIINIG